MPSSSSLVDEIRSASREFVREHGFLERTLAGTDLSPSAVHAIIEIGGAGELTARQLSDTLQLEKSTISRLVQSLEKRGELRLVPNASDGRSTLLRLTDKGQETLKAVTAFGRRKVRDALAHLDKVAAEDLGGSLSAYVDALKAARQDSRSPQRPSPLIVEGYRTGMIGDIAALHARTHGPILGMGPRFETVVAAAMGEFMSRIDRPMNNSWSVLDGGRVVASITVDGEDLGGNVAHLRWFILDEELRGLGLGRKLLQLAMDHCDRHGFDEIRLWTLKGLDAARKLYELNGFEITGEYEGDQWGQMVIEQTFSRKRPG